MEAGEFDETAFFAAIAASGARALLIGRRALVALGLPLLTADYDFWLHADDVARFVETAAPFDLHPGAGAVEGARARGRLVLENDERVDLLLAASMPAGEERLAFVDAWSRRQTVEVAPGVGVALPSLDDLIATKRFGARPRDLEDIRLLEALRRRIAT